MFTLALDNMWYILHMLLRLIIVFTSNNIFIGIYFHILLVKNKLGSESIKNCGQKFENKN